MNNRKTGGKYEQLATDFLINKGYSIIDRNYYTIYGEIDIIAKYEEIIVFVEVKYRSNNIYGTPIEAVDYKKREKIKKTALYYYSVCEYSDSVPCRFDVIGIDKDNNINHIENAFYM